MATRAVNTNLRNQLKKGNFEISSKEKMAWVNSLENISKPFI
jgi:hypothetical protein